MGDRVFKALAAGSGGLLLVIMAAIAIFLIWKAIPAFTENTGNIFTTQTWNPQGNPPVFGMAAVFFGTVISSVIAMIDRACRSPSVSRCSSRTTPPAGPRPCWAG